MSSFVRVASIVAVAVVAGLLVAGCGKGTTKTVTQTEMVTTTVAVPPAPAPPAAPAPPPAPNGGEEPAPGGAPAIIVHTSIAGIKMGMTKSQVKGRLGPPTSQKTEQTELGKYTSLFYDGLVVGLDAYSGKVFQIRTERDGDVTDKAVGVGSTQGQVTDAYPAATCDPDSPAICRIDKGNGTVTDFLVVNGKVTAVIVGYLQD